VSRLNQVHDQTAFLLEMQKAAKQECSELFDDLLTFIDGQLKKMSSDSDEAHSLEKTYDMISGQAQKLVEETDDDIAFLQEQLKAFVELKGRDNDEEAHDLLESLIGKDQELLETEDFKKQIAEETLLAKRNLIGMVEDVQSALAEGSFKDVELLLESMLEEAKNEEEEEQAETEGEGCCSGSCPPGGCNNCAEGCGPGDMKNLFSMVSEYNRDLEEDDAPKEKEEIKH